MATMAASGPSSVAHSNGTQDEYASWNRAATGYNEQGSMNHAFDGYDSPESPQDAQNGTTDNYFNLRESRSSSRAAKQPQTKRAKDGTLMTYDDESSKWIHRDKLAKIESQELQAAGIILPKSRAQSQTRSRQDRSRSRRRGTTDSSEQAYAPVSRKNSDLNNDRTQDAEPASWDFRLPEEIAEDPGEYWISNSNGSGRGTRIPVAKTSHVPIPTDYIDRNAPVQRKQSFPRLDEEPSIVYPKTRSRSSSIANALDDSPNKAQPGRRVVTDGSPRKVSTAPRKTSAPTKPTPNGRPKTRNGTGTTRSSSATRPTTRSGEISPRAPEGDPPWMISAYQPDPRLPPDQQLLPTVAKRLQQEKWEQEGSFGDVYDKEFRPLNEKTFNRPPELEKPQEREDNEEATQDEWPLKPEARVPTPSRPGTSSYSTMPKIQDAPALSPLAGQRPMREQQQQSQTQTSVSVKADPPAQSEEPSDKGGCGCCIVM
ncbi:hypothetical protein F4808DRAFT_213660 [Astrocystis sublimbata]|nr:hypothetical protein F4808DRAFT_213660 [Astrocystis sublimbata]